MHPKGTTLARTKRCTKCGQAKPHGEFFRDSTKPDGLEPRCKVCRTLARRARAEAHSPCREQAGPDMILCACGCGTPTLLAVATSPRDGWVKGQPLRFLPNHHSRGENNGRFKGEQHPALGPFGRHTPTHTYPSNGYTLCYVPDHPHATHNGYVFLHRLVVERELGRYLLPSERVDHIDRDRGNSTPGNLRVFASQAEHMREAHGPGARWSSFADSCTVCGSATIPHAAGGVCRNCYVRGRRRDPARTWGQSYPACVNCGTTSSYHAGHGLCHNCDMRQRRRKLANAS